MIKTILITAVTAAALLVVLCAALIFGSFLWEKKTARLTEQLEGASQTGSSIQPRAAAIETTTLEAAQKHPEEIYRPEDLESLPDPVRRYFLAVLPPETRMVQAATITHRGTFNMAEEGSNWKPFTSEQRVITRRPGFLWNAAISMLPGVKARVHDAYIGGEGMLHASFGGLFSIMDLRGGDELARGELMRYFAEAAWYPSALLPSRNVAWEAVDEHSARATIVDGNIELSLLFRFNEEGLIESVYSPGRGRTVEGTTRNTPWEGRWSNYQRRDGMLIPLTGEALWHTPAGEQPYWRGNIEDIRYSFLGEDKIENS